MSQPQTVQSTALPPQVSKYNSRLGIFMAMIMWLLPAGIFVTLCIAYFSAYRSGGGPNFGPSASMEAYILVLAVIIYIPVIVKTKISPATVNGKRIISTGALIFLGYMIAIATLGIFLLMVSYHPTKNGRVYRPYGVQFLDWVKGNDKPTCTAGIVVNCYPE